MLSEGCTNDCGWMLRTPAGFSEQCLKSPDILFSGTIVERLISGSYPQNFEALASLADAGPVWGVMPKRVFGHHCKLTLWRASSSDPVKSFWSTHRPCRRPPPIPYPLFPSLFLLQARVPLSLCCIFAGTSVEGATPSVARVRVGPWLRARDGHGGLATPPRGAAGGNDKITRAAVVNSVAEAMNSRCQVGPSARVLFFFLLPLFPRRRSSPPQQVRIGG